MLGANRLQTFWRVVHPLVLPGLLTTGVLAVVRTIAKFELTFLVADASSSTLVVGLFGEAFGAGIRPNQAIDAFFGRDLYLDDHAPLKPFHVRRARAPQVGLAWARPGWARWVG